MLIKKPADIAPSEITPRDLYLNRRSFIGGATALAAGALPGTASAIATDANARGPKLPGVVETEYKVDEELTPYESVTEYNNFYEFGTGKRDPARNSGRFKPMPWSVEFGGECERPGTVGLEDVLEPHALEERIYRLRCVEAWSMVIPWVGIPLGPLLSRFAPTSRAKYVAFETVVRPQEMPGVGAGFIDWPYVEGLRMDEAMNPLAFMAVGLYGESLPNQNGAPIRLVLPWKYGFKSIKSIVRITFTEKEPPTTWNIMLPGEYGFYANVNPEVSHPRWSQARERRIGEIFKRDTLMFNGYAEQVASLYAGMDLRAKY